MIAAPFEICQGALARTDRIPQPAGDDIDLRETRRGEGVELLQPVRAGDPGRLVAVLDRDF